LHSDVTITVCAKGQHLEALKQAVPKGNTITWSPLHDGESGTFHNEILAMLLTAVHPDAPH
jgi:hypothetical protein